MICYRDKTFCPFATCAKFDDCLIALTDTVKAAACLWWGSDNAPIAKFTNAPGCFIDKEKGVAA